LGISQKLNVDKLSVISLSVDRMLGISLTTHFLRKRSLVKFHL